MVIIAQFVYPICNRSYILYMSFLASAIIAPVRHPCQCLFWQNSRSFGRGAPQPLAFTGFVIIWKFSHSPNTHLNQGTLRESGWISGNLPTHRPHRTGERPCTIHSPDHKIWANEKAAVLHRGTCGGEKRQQKGATPAAQPRTISTSLAKAAASLTASSASILRLTVMFCFFRPLMKAE